jgi:energy-coupling factor transporter ATP-binding protein EcfA2
VKIKAVTVNRFRGYSEPVVVELDDLSVFVGRNDIGKSTILEALDVFFNEGKGCVKIDKEDINKSCLARGEDQIEVSVEFTELPVEIVIDSANRTTLASEYLTTEQGTLHIVKRFSPSGKERVFICARHPTADGCRDLHQKKISELRKAVDDNGFSCSDKTRSAELRRAIWAGHADVELGECEIEIAKEDTKAIWDQLKAKMPMFMLFQSDRKNAESDDEVQDPMRVAVREILGDPVIRANLREVADRVRARLEDVAGRTLEKLRELNPQLAASLDPQIPDSDALKWSDVFKSVGISGDQGIPINKRGSGVKRLVLISFFRAEAERRLAEAGNRHVVYAIEEPETSQHPEHQRGLTAALKALSTAQATQVLLTTHSPEVVKHLSFDCLRLVSSGPQQRVSRVLPNELPYPSLNEVSFSAFGESTSEYHDELYAHIEACGDLDAFRTTRPLVDYIRLLRNGSARVEKISSTDFIRHQIHHPENPHNQRYSPCELHESIEAMRSFIKEQRNSVCN